jgi:hypothetical protein
VPILSLRSYFIAVFVVEYSSITVSSGLTKGSKLVVHG